MKNNLSIEDLVGRYLDKEMTETERLDFERQMASDPAIGEEISFQKDLISSIKESRRIELKSRLSEIQVPSFPILQTVGLKIAAIASVTAILGTGAYFLINSADKSDLSNVDISQTTTIIAQDTESVPTIPEVTIPAFEEFESEEVVVEEKPAKTNKKKRDDGNESASLKTSKSLAQPNVVRPDIAEVTEEKEPETEDFAEEETYSDLDDIKETMTDKLAVETDKNRRYSFHYKFYNEKLYLLGDFKDSPYEILELNSSGGRRYFLFYEGDYYRLSPDKLKPTPLEKLTDETMVEELRIIQQNK